MVLKGAKDESLRYSRIIHFRDFIQIGGYQGRVDEVTVSVDDLSATLSLTVEEKDGQKDA